jgi:hypothetical protein
MSQQSDDLVTVPRSVIAEARRALREARNVSLTLKGSLSTPYTDAPEWTPWTRWVRPMGKRADRALAALARAEKDADAKTGEQQR